MANDKNRLITREELDEEAKNLLAEHEFVNDKGEALSANADIFHEYLKLMVSKYRDAMGDSTLSEDAVKLAKGKAKSALNLYNDEMRVQRLEQLKTMGCQTAVVAFLGTQMTRGLKLKIKESDKSVEIEDCKTVEIDAPDFYNFMLTAEKSTVLDEIVLFTYNVQRYHAHCASKEERDSGKKEHTRQVKSLSASYQKLLEEKGWNYAVGEMNQKILNEDASCIVDRLCFHNNENGAKTDKKGRKILNHFLKLYAADFCAIRDAICINNAAQKGQGDKPIVYVTPDEWTVVRALFRAMFTRYNNLAIGHVDQSNGQHSARTVKANKDMAESSKNEEYGPKVEAEAGPVTLGTPEK